MYNNKFHIYNNNSKGSRVARVLGFIFQWGALIMVAAVSALPAVAAPFAYVANRFDNTVSVIDTATKMVVATIPVGNNPSGIAVSPDGKRVYVANSGSNNVSMIDTTSCAVATVPVGNSSLAIAVTPDGTRAYVANSTMNILRGNGIVSVIDTAGNTVMATIAGVGPLGRGGYATAVAVAPNGQYAYVTTAGNDVASTVSVVDSGTSVTALVTHLADDRSKAGPSVH
jgi:YVTN family beta-propeller protein